MKRLFPAILHIIFSLILTGPATLPAQWGLGLSFSSTSDDNAFRNYEQFSDIIYAPEWTLYYDFPRETGNTRLFYHGSAYLFTEMSVRQFSLHNLGIAGNGRFMENGPRFLWGLQTGRRVNQTEYRYYDFQNTEGYLHLKTDQSDKSHWLLGTRVKFRTYDNLPEFSHSESQLFLQSSIFLRTRSTLIARIQAGYKHFLENKIDEETIVETVPAGQGRQQGRGNPNSPSNSSKTITRTITVESAQPSSWQLAASLRLAQSVFKTTGLALEANIHSIPSDASRILNGQDSGYGSSDDLYDDPYSFDMDEISLELTQILPWTSRLKAGWRRTEKRYQQPAYDLEGNALESARLDRVSSLWATWTKTLPFKPLKGRLALSLTWAWLDNDSNDPYFKYKNTVTRLGFDFSM